MHELLFEKAWIQHKPIVTEASQYDPCFRPLILALAANVARIESAWMLLPYLVDTAALSAEASVTALCNVLGTHDMSDPRQSDTNIQSRLVEAATSAGWAIEGRRGKQDVLELALLRLDRILLNSPSDFITLGIETVLASQILNAWTAVESFTKDLWETAINEGPREWISCLLKNGPLKQVREQEKSVGISILQKFRFNLSGRMGTILKGKISFETISDLIDAFRAVFGEEFTKSYSEETLRNVVALEALRNLFAHRAGIVDYIFHAKVKHFIACENCDWIKGAR